MSQTQVMTLHEKLQIGMRSIELKKHCYVLLTVLLCAFNSILTSCALFGGITHPKIDFSYDDLDDLPPFAKEQRFEAGDKYPQEITFFLRRYGNDFKTVFAPSFFVKKPYEKLVLYEMRCEWDTGDIVLASNKEYFLEKEYYRERDGYYWRGVRFGPGGFLQADFTKIFKNKKPGDEFDVKFTLRYSFEDEPERTEVLEFHVKAYKGEWKWPTWAR
jgi:hypothetical protein